MKKERVKVIIKQKAKFIFPYIMEMFIIGADPIYIDPMNISCFKKVSWV